MTENSKDLETNSRDGKFRNSKNPKGKRFRKDRKFGSNPRAKDEVCGKPGNDFSWWNKYPDLLDNAANVKSNWIPGSFLDPNDITALIPGVVKVVYMPTYGNSTIATDPVNVWARDLYLRMFQKWRGISAYSAADLGICILAGIEVVRTVARLERIYGVVNRYSRLNRNMPVTELSALGLTTSQADWVRDHLADFRYDLNVLLLRAQRLCVPKDMSVISNVISLNAYEYLDHDNIKGQIIIFDTPIVGTFESTKLSTGGAMNMKTRSIFGSGSTFLIDDSGSGNMFPLLEAQIAALVGDDGIQKIYGDLVTWFGSEAMLHFDPLPEDYIVTPVYSESIMHKIHNIDPLPSPTTQQSVIMLGLPSADAAVLQALSQGEYYIYQFNDAIVTALGTCAFQGSTPTYMSSTKWPFAIPTLAGSQGLHLNTKPTVLDSYRVDITQEFIVEGTLFKYSVNPEQFVQGGSTYYGGLIQGLGFEFVTAVVLYSYNPAGGSVTPSYSYTLYNNAGTSQQKAGELAIMDWAPLIYYAASASAPYSGLYGDVDTALPMHAVTKQKILEAIVFSGLKTDMRVLDTVHQ